MGGEPQHHAPEKPLAPRYGPRRNRLVERGGDLAMHVHRTLERPAPVAARQAVASLAEKLDARILQRVGHIDRSRAGERDLHGFVPTVLRRAPDENQAERAFAVATAG